MKVPGYASLRSASGASPPTTCTPSRARFLSGALAVATTIVVALAVPVSQLRTIDVVTTCCCPDPSHCHCPDHKTDHSGQPAMRACHRSQHELVSPQAPTFVAPEFVLAAPPATPATPIVLALADPHAEPPPQRPDAPS